MSREPVSIMEMTSTEFISVANDISRTVQSWDDAWRMFRGGPRWEGGAPPAPPAEAIGIGALGPPSRNAPS